MTSQPWPFPWAQNSEFRDFGRLGGQEELVASDVSKKHMLSFSDWLSAHMGVSTGDSFFSVTHEDRKALGLNMCGACKLTCCVSSSWRRVSLCVSPGERVSFLAGKLPDMAFAPIWANSPVFESFRELEIRSCESCDRFELCHGG